MTRSWIGGGRGVSGMAGQRWRGSKVMSGDIGESQDALREAILRIEEQASVGGPRLGTLALQLLELSYFLPETKASDRIAIAKELGWLASGGKKGSKDTLRSSRDWDAELEALARRADDDGHGECGEDKAAG
jgi:hypothetical protein